MTKKVALINPGRGGRFDAHEPLQLGFIASSLIEKGVEVKIIDEVAGDNVELGIKDYKPDIAGITATTPFVEHAYRHADFCRQQGVLTVLGGVHATVMTEEALRHADIVVKGEGEQAMLDIVSGGAREKVITRDYIRDLDTLPPPAYQLMNMDFYLNARERAPYNTALIFVPKGYKVASMLTGRGCPYSCIFCHNTWRGMPFRFNSPERVVRDMKYLIDTYKTQAIAFFDDDFFANKERAKKIFQLIREDNLGIIWGCNCRVNTIDEQILKEAFQAGCRQIAFGFESGSQKMLDIMQKRTKVEENKKAVELCKEAGIICVAFFILGLPHETKADIQLTRKFIMENDIDCIGLCMATPFPGTQIWDWCKEKGFIPQIINWKVFSPDDTQIRVSEFLTVDEIKRLRSRIFFDFAMKPASLARFLKMSLSSPAQAAKKVLRIFRHI
ncbi:MAG: radical SAM protein [Candidatus Omnitrophota bacterium]